MFPHEVMKVPGPGAAAQGIATRMAGRVPGVDGHGHVGFECVIERRARALGQLRMQDAKPAAVVAFLPVKVAGDGLLQPLGQLRFIAAGAHHQVHVEFRTTAMHRTHQRACVQRLVPSSVPQSLVYQ